MSKAPKEKDFGKSEPQVSSVYQHRVPPILRNFDEAKGGLASKPVVIEDEHFDSNFEPPPVPDLSFFSRTKGRK